MSERCNSNLHEDIAAWLSQLSDTSEYIWRSDLHLVKVWRDVDINQSGDVFMWKVPQQRQLAEGSLCELYLLGHSCDHFDSHRLPRHFIYSRAVCRINIKCYSVSNTSGGNTYMTYPYAPLPISRISFHRFSTWNTFPNDDINEW